jgi:hypothetical protein
MDHTGAPMLLFATLCHWLMSDLVQGLTARMTFGTGMHLILCPTILSGALALLVKYLVAMRILPIYKLLSGSLGLLLVSWYIDRICKNNAYLMVRSVGVAIIFCAGLVLVIVSEDGFADKGTRIEAEAVTIGENVVARD